jgi:hypothetical protein
MNCSFYTAAEHVLKLENPFANQMKEGACWSGSSTCLELKMVA